MKKRPYGKQARRLAGVAPAQIAAMERRKNSLPGFIRQSVKSLKNRRVPSGRAATRPGSTASRILF
ncbi:hypothetical protein LJC48_03370 [Desulfovibrio sp. OttesenSCG-928-C06]|nr:hypothetical protein [Desulfovibrio sp. OttesenSCG-928-C06]